MSNVIEFPRPKVDLPIQTREEFWAYKRDGAKVTKEHARHFEKLLAEALKAQSAAAPARQASFNELVE